MEEKRVLVTSHIPEVGVQLLKSAGLYVTFWDNNEPLPDGKLNALAAEHDAILSSSANKLDATFLESCAHLDIISQFAVGYDNIDVPEASRRGIAIGNAPGVMTEATADIAFGLMIATSRKMFYLNQSIRDGNWTHFVPRANLGLELRNRTLGVFGLGRIGMEMARLCRSAYGMKIIYCNRSLNPEAENQLHATKVDLDTLLKESDVLSVHCKLTEDTKGTFDALAFSRMKPTSIFINTSRGAVHDEKALTDALKNRTIWGAGLDVTNPEPMHKDNPLLKLENVCVLPHVGSATVHTRNEMSRLAAENIIAFYKGEIIPHLINPEFRSNI